MHIESTTVIQALSTVIDPKSGQNIILRSMVKDLKIDDKQISFSLIINALDQNTKSSLNFACIEAIQKVYPQANVHVHLLTPNTNKPKPEKSLSHIKNVIAVASGKGGVGKSTVAVNLALGLQQMGAKVGLLDADVYGPSIPTMFGLQGQRPKVKDVYGKPRLVPLAAYDIPLMSIGFIIDAEQAVVLRGPRLAGIIKQFIEDVLWPELDYLIIDLPPGTGDVHLTMVQTIAVTGAVLVTTPQEVAIADAIKAMNMFLMPSVNVPILGVVENMAWFTPEELPNNKYYIFGQGGGKKLAKLSESMVLGQVPLVQGIRESGDEGIPIVMQTEHPAVDYFRKVAANTVRQVALRNEILAPTQVVQMKT